MYNSRFLSLQGSRILVTGGSGFIGTNLVKTLLDLNCDVLNLSIDPPKIVAHRHIYAQTDVCDRERLLQLFKSYQPDYCIHLAARTDLKGKSLLDYTANIKGVSNVIEAVNATSSIRLALYVSSRLVFKIGYTPRHDFDYTPTTLYGESKCCGEKLVVSQDVNSTPWIILRPTSIWGEWFSVPYRNFFDSILKKRYVHPGSRVVLKSFGYIGNVIYQILCYLEASPGKHNRQAYFLSDFTPINVLNFANSISSLAGLPPVRKAPYNVLSAVAKAGDIAQRLGVDEPPLTSFRLSNLITNMVYDLSREEQICGPLPYSFDDGIISTLSWINSEK